MRLRAGNQHKLFAIEVRHPDGPSVGVDHFDRHATGGVAGFVLMADDRDIAYSRRTRNAVGSAEVAVVFEEPCYSYSVVLAEHPVDLCCMVRVLTVNDSLSTPEGEDQQAGRAEGLPLTVQELLGSPGALTRSTQCNSQAAVGGEGESSVD